MEKKRIVAFTSDNVAVGVYDNIAAAAKETNRSKNEIARNLRGFGPTYIRGLRFEYEVTNKELRQARLEDRKKRQAQKQKELDKWVKIYD